MNIIGSFFIDEAKKAVLDTEAVLSSPICEEYNCPAEEIKQIKSDIEKIKTAITVAEKAVGMSETEMENSGIDIPSVTTTIYDAEFQLDLRSVPMLMSYYMDVEEIHTQLIPQASNQIAAIEKFLAEYPASQKLQQSLLELKNQTAILVKDFDAFNKLSAKSPANKGLVEKLIADTSSLMNTSKPVTMGEQQELSASFNLQIDMMRQEAASMRQQISNINNDIMILAAIPALEITALLAYFLVRSRPTLLTPFVWTGGKIASAVTSGFGLFTSVVRAPVTSREEVHSSVLTASNV